MAYDDLLFAWLGKVNKTTQIPLVSTILGSISVILISTFLSLDQITQMLAFGNILADTSVAVVLIVLRYSDQTCHSKEKATLGESLMNGEKQPLFEKKSTGWKNKQTALLTFFLILSCCSTIFLVVFECTQAMFYLIAFLFICLLAFIVLFAFWLSSKKIDRKDKSSFQVPFVPLVPGAAILLNCCIISQLDWPAWLSSLLWNISGVSVYFVYGMRNSHLEEKHLPEDMTDPEKQKIIDSKQH